MKSYYENLAHESRSGLVNYGRLTHFVKLLLRDFSVDCREYLCDGDPGVTRTPGLLLRRQSLYPLSYGASILQP